MTTLKDLLVQIVRCNAAKNIADLTGEFVRARPEEKEAILARLDFERWLAETCQVCLEKQPQC
jgi:hypothetical protein